MAVRFKREQRFILITNYPLLLVTLVAEINIKLTIEDLIHLELTSTMDLVEIQPDSSKRHPWEISRVIALRSILAKAKIFTPAYRVLDVGTGDGFTISKLFKEGASGQVDAVDINLSDLLIETYSSQFQNVNFYNSLDALKEESYDLILLFDVLEHVENDSAFLKKLIDDYTTKNAKVFATVPAFNSLFGSHDIFLKHYRRYNLKEFLNVLENAGLQCMFSGYLFFLPLLHRFISLQMERIRKNSSKQNKGIGKWNGGYLSSKLLTLLLNSDNFISLTLNRLGIKIPGLTVWALCQKRQ